MEAHNERVYKIARKVAYGTLVNGDDDTESVCPYCSYTYEYNGLNADETPLHTPDCIVTLARAEMKSQGTPLLKYRVNYEYSPYKWRPDAIACATHIGYAYDEQEIRKQYEGETTRNMQVECLGEIA